MPIDASIALQSRPAQMEDPLTQYGKALSLKQLMQQGQMQDQQMQEQNAVRKILRESQGNLTPEVLGKIREVSPAAAFTFEKSLRENQKAGQEFEKGEQDLDEGDLKIRAQKVSRLASLAGSIKDEATKDQAIGTALREGLLDPETATKIMSQPYETIKPQLAQFQQEAMTAAQQMEEEHRAATAKRQEGQAAETARHNKVIEGTAKQQADTAARPNTPTELAVAATDPKKTPEERKTLTDALTILERHAKASRTVIGTGTGTQDNIKSTAQGIAEGRLPPPDVSSRPTQYSLALTGELQRMGYDLTKASRDWKAVQKHMSSLNGAQQLRLRQAVDAVFQHTDLIESLYDEWKKVGKPSGFKILNKANLALAKQLPGRAGEVAQGLEAQVNDLISELGTAYKGGNSSTDETLRLAQENLKADWNEQQFSRALKLIKQNMQIRKNSIESTQPSGVSQDSPYVPEVKAQPHGTTSGPQIGQVVKLRNGKSVKIKVVHPDGTFDGDEVK